MTDDDDRKVKEVLDAATQADLERWFGLPSFQQLADQGVTPQPPAIEEDLELAAVIERRDKALAAVDPILLDAIHARIERDPSEVLRMDFGVELKVDENIGAFDEAMIARIGSIADPRELEPSEELHDDMKDCTPQALLRDLHRAELYFEKQFEVVDALAEQRVDIVAEVKAAMSTRWIVRDFGESPWVEGVRLLARLRDHRRRPWTEYLPQLQTRSVRE
jgi:hypothetical protein